MNMTATAPLWGTLRGDLVLRLPRSPKGEDRAVQIHPDTSLSFERPNGEVISMTRDRWSDGMSGWSILWPLIGSPLTGRVKDCAFIHDELCARKDRPSAEAHRVMYEAMRSRGLWFRGPLIYRGLLIGGARWKFKQDQETL